MPISQRVARIQAKLDAFLTDTATIQKRVDVQDSAGVPGQGDWQSVGVGVKCRVIDSQSRMVDSYREIAQTDAMVNMVRIIFPVGTVCEQDHRVIVNGRVYHVVAVLDTRTDAVDMQVHAKQVRGDDDVS